jgi:translation initiation factor 2B subunit (eIF-2B alpha/beta/delta family)
MIKHLKDDNKLPFEIKSKLDNIAYDNSSGSVLLTKKTIEVFKLLVEKYSNNDNFKNLFKSTSKFIVDSQPEMASIFSFLNNALFCFDKYFDHKDFDKYLFDYFESELQRIKQSSERICKHSYDLIPRGSNVFVYSNSSTVYDYLLYSKNKNLRILCSESRPINEGISLCKNLGEKGFDVELIIDAAVFSKLHEINFILIGADAITSEGLVNKIGTSGFLMAAHNLCIPSFILCGIDKILPYSYNLKIENKNPREIISYDLKNVKITNQYFDITPWTYVQNIITEDGIVSNEKIMEIIKKLAIHEIFVK